jgi:hypothetical protein
MGHGALVKIFSDIITFFPWMEMTSLNEEKKYVFLFADENDGHE